MKTILLLSIFVFGIVLSNAQNFYVVKVEGKVYKENTLLKTGDKMSENDVLRFSDQNDKLYILSPSSGYFLLTPSQQDKTQKEWVVALKNALIPQNKYYKTATRGVANSNASFDDRYDLMGFFRGRILIVQNAPFQFNADKIPLNSSNYFEFKNQNGEEKLTVFVNGKNFTLNGNFNQAQFEMNYIQNTKKNKIGVFEVKLVERQFIANELKVFFLNQDKNKSTSVYYEQVVPFITEAYGNTNFETIKEIISKDLNIELSVRN